MADCLLIALTMTDDSLNNENSNNIELNTKLLLDDSPQNLEENTNTHDDSTCDEQTRLLLVETNPNNYDAVTDGGEGAGYYHFISDNNDINNDNELPTVAETVAGLAGNVLELYDFAIFAFFSDVLSEVFFPPSHDHNVNLVKTYLLFGVAFVFRPIGGLLMGYIGDTYGRKRALEISIFMMAFPTFLMGCLPSYSAIGRMSWILLLIVRLLQGLSLGGQLMSSLLFTIEKRPVSTWGFYGSLVFTCANAGILFASGVGSLIRFLVSNPKDLEAWGWRVPFLCGIFVSLSAFYLKHHVEEVSINDDVRDRQQNAIKLTLQRSNWINLIVSFLGVLIWSAGFYFTFVWLPTFMIEISDHPLRCAFAINSVNLSLAGIVLFPIFGSFSDRFGRTFIMKMGGVCCFLIPPFAMSIINRGNLVSSLVAQLVLGISVTIWGAPLGSWIASNFQANIRVTSVAFSYNAAQVVVGGFIPSIATVLVDSYGAVAPGLFISFLAMTSLFGLSLATQRTSSSSSPSSLLSSDAKITTHLIEEKLGTTGKDQMIVRNDKIIRV